MERILIVEDEPTISRVLKVYLVKYGYDVTIEENGKQALTSFFNTSPHLVLLDIMLPDADGWTILSSIREQSSCPVIMLTALGEVDDRLKGLDSGADDYITKPFIAEEVVARVKAILRRPQDIYQEQHTIRYGPLHLYTTSHRITVHGEEIDLPPRDRALLLFLAKHPKQSFSRDQLLDRVWGIDYEGSDRAVDLSVKRIRKTLRHGGMNDGGIKTIRGLGYQFFVKHE